MLCCNLKSTHDETDGFLGFCLKMLLNVMENDASDETENDDDYQKDDLAADYTSDGDCVLFLIVIQALIIIIVTIDYSLCE